MKFNDCFSDDAQLKRVFSWLTRIGAAPKFGTRPVSWYQAHQCHCIDIIREILQKAGLPADTNLICRQKCIFVDDYRMPKNVAFALLVRSLYDMADTRSRS